MQVEHCVGLPRALCVRRNVIAYLKHVDVRVAAFCILCSSQLNLNYKLIGEVGTVVLAKALAANRALTTACCAPRILGGKRDVLRRRAVATHSGRDRKAQKRFAYASLFDADQPPRQQDRRHGRCRTCKSACGKLHTDRSLLRTPVHLSRAGRMRL